MLVAVVPAYNEEKTIGAVVKKLLSFVDKVVVVDDASSDNTFEIAKQHEATVLRHKINRGQGAALETGQTYARSMNADHVIHFDGDGQFVAEEIPHAVEALRKEQADILLGSRFLTGHSNIPFSKRVFILPLARLFDRFFFRTFLNGFP